MVPILVIIWSFIVWHIINKDIMQDKKEIEQYVQTVMQHQEECISSGNYFHGWSCYKKSDYCAVVCLDIKENECIERCLSENI